MSLDIARLGFDIDSSALRSAKGDLTEFSRTAEQTDDKVRRASDGIERSLSTAAGRSSTAWAKFRESFGGANGIAAVVAASGATLAVSRMVEVARASEEAQALFDQVFQGSAASVREWSNVMAAEINRSAYDLQAQAAQFQQVLAAMVPDRSRAAAMSTTLAGLAQDISAFYDISEGDALAKLRSGLTGETEPLKALGIVLSAASVEAKALELGIASTASEMTEADKVAARYALIMQLTADAQGAATREAESLSNQQKGLTSALNDAYRSLGQTLLPIVTQATVALADMARAFNALSPETQKFIAYAAGIVAALGPLLGSLGLVSLAIPPITAALALVASPVGLAVAAIAGLTAAGVLLYRNWDELTAKYPALQTAIDKLVTALDWLGRATATVINTLKPLVSFLGDNLTSAVRTVSALLKGDFVGAFQEMGTQARANMDAIASLALTWGRSIVSQIMAGLRGLYEVGKEAMAELARGFRDSVSGLIADAKNWGADIASGLANGVANGAGRVKGAVTNMASGVKGWFTDDLEIQSPSRVFMRYGEFITGGLALGIKNGASAPTAAISEVAQDLVQRTDRLSSDLAGAWGDWLTGGLRNFKEFASNILSGFKRMVSDMIATAAANPIRLAITTAMGGMPGAAAAGAPGVPGGGGLLSGILGSWGGGTGLLGGAGSVVNGLMSGGLSGGISGLTTALSGGLMTAIGGLIPVVGAAAAVFSFFKSKTKELDRGLRVTVTGMDAVIETFRKTEKSRFWGLSKKRKTSYDPASDEIADPIDRALGKVQQSVLDAAGALNVGEAAFQAFAYQFKLSTKDMTDEQALQAIQEEIGKFGDAYAAMIPGLKEYQAEGEGASATLARLSASLGVVNGALGDLGLSLYEASLSGAGAAASFAELFGSLDAFQQASGAYYQAFYSEQERLARLTQVTREALWDAGMAVPATREAFRSLVEAQDLSTEAGREAAAVLLQLAPAFDQIYGAAEQAAGSAANLAQALAEAAQTQAQVLRDTLTPMQQAAAEQARMAATYERLGIAVPQTITAYRALIQGLDLTTESGRATLAALASVSGAMMETFDAAEQAAQAARDAWVDASAALGKMLRDSLTPDQQAAADQAQLLRVFRDLGAAVPQSVTAYRALIQSLDLTTEAGRAALAAINGVSGALLDTFDAARNAAEAARKAAEDAAQAAQQAWVASSTDLARLLRETLTPDQQVAADQAKLRRAFDDMGLAVPQTMAAYRQILQSLDLTTESGRAALETITSVSETLITSLNALGEAEKSRQDLLVSLMTDQQRAAYEQEQITAAFAALNMQVPTTLAGLQAIIRGLDLTGEAGRNALAQIAGIADALKEQLGGVSSEVEREMRIDAGRTDYANKVKDERKRLEAQIISLTESESQKRQREIAEREQLLKRMDPVNASLQAMIWGLEDAKKAMDDLTTDGFATLVDYELARAKAANINMTPAATPAAEKKAREDRQRQERDSEQLARTADYAKTLIIEMRGMAREMGELRMLQEGGAA